MERDKSSIESRQRSPRKNTSTMASSLRRRALPLLHRAVFHRRPLVPIMNATVPLTQFPIRHMGGGPRNPEHKNRPKEVKKAIRRAKAEKRKANTKPLPDIFKDPPKAMMQPVPEQLHPYLPAIETYVVNEWLPRFPDGARLRKLQRDVAFRLKPRTQSPGKLPMQNIMTIVGVMSRKGIIRIRQSPKGSVVIMSPEKEGDRPAEESANE